MNIALEARQNNIPNKESQEMIEMKRTRLQIYCRGQK